MTSPMSPTERAALIPDQKEYQKKRTLGLRLRHTVVIVISLIVMIGIAANIASCNKGPAGTTSQNPEVTQDGQTTGRVLPTPTPEPTAITNPPAKIGETVDHKGYKMTVLNVETSQGGEHVKPDEGHEFVFANVRIENATTTAQFVNLSFFGLKDSNGEIISADSGASLAESGKTQISALQLVPGGKTEGYISFEAPKGDKGLVLQYQPTLFDKKDAIQISLAK